MRSSASRVSSLLYLLVFLSAGSLTAQEGGGSTPTGPVFTASVPAAPAPYEGWKVLETDHFRFIYEPAHESAAVEAAGYAEEVYEVVTDSMDYYPDNVPVVIRGRTAGANGYYTPFPHQINLFVTSPSGPWMGARSESWIKVLFIHEFTHYVHFANRKGFLGALSRLFGHDLTAAHGLFFPGWLLEGITVTNESYYSEGGRGSNPFFAMKYRAFIEEGSFWSYRKSKFGSAYAPRDRIYVAGYLYVDYLRETYGDKVVADIHQAFARAPILGIPRAVRKVTGVHAHHLHARMIARLREEYEPSSTRRGRERVSPDRQGDWYLPLATDAGYYYYSTSHEEAPGIWRVDALDARLPAAERLLRARLTDAYSFDVTRDGKTVLFASSVPDSGHPAGLSSYSELYRQEVDTGGSSGEPVRLTTGARLQQPAISPNGEHAVAVERRGSHSRLVAVNPASGAAAVLYEAPGVTVKYPRFSPDGERVAFVRNLAGEQDLIVADVVSREPSSESQDSASRLPEDVPPAWHLQSMRNITASWPHPVYLPRFVTSQEITFSSDPEATTELYLAHLGRGALFRLLQDPVAAWAALSPASEDEPMERVVYGSYSTTGTTLFRGPVNPERLGAIESVPLEKGAGQSSGESGERSLDGSSDDSAAVGGAIADASAYGAVSDYRDIPKPILWFPLAGAQGTIDDGPTVSVGSFLLATSTLQKHQLQGTLFYTPQLLQPGLSLSYSYSPGPVSLGYGLSYDYTETDTAEALLGNSLSLGVPLMRRERPGSTFSLGSSWSLGIENSWEADRSFEVGDLGSVESESESFVGAGFSLSRSVPIAPKSFYGERYEAATTTVRYYPQLFDRQNDLVETVSSLGILRRLPGAHHAAGLSLRAGTSNEGEGDKLVSPRGGVDWDRSTGDVELMPSLRYLIPLGLWEGRFLGVNFLGGGTFLFAETSFVGDFAERLRWGEEYYLGAELDVRMQVFNIVPLLGRAGIVTRVDAQTGVDDGLEDLYLYVNASVSIPSVSENATLY